jgi:hypothetical protein
VAADPESERVYKFHRGDVEFSAKDLAVEHALREARDAVVGLRTRPSLDGEPAEEDKWR